MPRQILALDFDGVICNSAMECLITSYGVYAAARGDDYSHRLDAVPAATRERFFALRPFIRDGQDYMLILHVIEQGIAIESQDDFDRAADTLAPEMLALYGLGALRELEDVFQAARRARRAANDGDWLASNTLYGGMRTALMAHRRDFAAIFITTSKPSAPARDILAHHGIALADDHVLGQDKVGESKHKNKHLARVRDVTEAPFGNIHFLEDQVSHLEAASPLQVNTYLAGWGYNTDAQRQRALAAGARVLREDDIADWMADILAAR